MSLIYTQLFDLAGERVTSPTQQAGCILLTTAVPVQRRYY